MDIILRASDLTKERVLNVIKYECAVGLSTVSKNDFEFTTKLSPDLIAIGKYVTYGNTEYGGKITERIIDTGKGIVTYRGKNFRGLLENVLLKTEQVADRSLNFNVMETSAFTLETIRGHGYPTIVTLARTDLGTAPHGTTYWYYTTYCNLYRFEYQISAELLGTNYYKVYDINENLLASVTRENTYGSYGNWAIYQPIYCSENKKVYLYDVNIGVTANYVEENQVAIDYSVLDSSGDAPLTDLSNVLLSGDLKDYVLVENLVGMREAPCITYTVTATTNTATHSRAFVAGTNYLTAIEQWLRLFAEKFTLSFESGLPVVNISAVATIAKQDTSRSSVVLSENQSVPNAIYSENGAKYIQVDGTVGATKYYTGDAEIALWSAGTALLDLDDALITARYKMYASDINAEITSGDVGDLVEVTVADLGVKATQKIVEKTLSYARGQEKIVYSTGG